MEERQDDFIYEEEKNEEKEEQDLFPENELEEKEVEEEFIPNSIVEEFKKKIEAIEIEKPSESIEETEEKITEQFIADTITKPIIEIAQKDETPWIFFDYSGTLVNTVNALSKTYTRFLGKEFPPESVKQLYKDYQRLGKLAIFRKYKFNPIKFIFGGKKKFEEIRKEEFWSGVRAFPGIPEVLLRLQKIVLAKFAIVTHETEIQDPVERNKIFQHFGLPNQFHEVITDSTNKEEKFNKFIQEKGIQYGIIIGDTQFDLDLGKKLNFYTIGVTWGFSIREEFNAHYIIDDPREILQVVMNLMHQIETSKLHGDP
ncbi:MAG: HAD hydrolase-like protein [Candidatus Heimdallarchaeota archaeon]|nr:HAD hydrolase-like protein [Candidatus Heimdallarchaeota archaeon]